MLTAVPAWNLDRTRILTRTEIAAVLADLDRRGRRSPGARLAAVVFRLATCAGLRASEIAGIALRDVQLGIDRPQLVVRKAVGKGSRGRKVPLHWDGATLAALRAWKETREREHGAQPGDRFVCALSRGALGNPLDRKAIRRRFLFACKVLGSERLANLTTHDGRHSFVSHALAGGRSLAEVRDAAGHANVATTSVYLHVVSDDGTVGDLFSFPTTPSGPRPEEGAQPKGRA